MTLFSKVFFGVALLWLYFPRYKFFGVFLLWLYFPNYKFFGVYAQLIFRTVAVLKRSLSSLTSTSLTSENFNYQPAKRAERYVWRSSKNGSQWIPKNGTQWIPEPVEKWIPNGTQKWIQPLEKMEPKWIPNGSQPPEKWNPNEAKMDPNQIKMDPTAKSAIPLITDLSIDVCSL